MSCKPFPRGRRRTPLARALVVIVGLSACGGTGGSSSDTAPDSPSDSPSDSQLDSASAADTGGPPEEFGLSLAELTTRVESTEQLIAKCMADAGFQYVALDFVTVKQAMDSDQSAPGLSDEDYVAQYGLGITTQFDKPLVVFGAGPQSTTYLAGLAEPDQVAYRRALWGENIEWNHARALEEEDFSPTGGCTRSAADQVYKPAELTAAYINPADILVDQDPRMIDALAAWSDCMAAEGFDYANPDQVDSDLHERLDAIVQGQDPTTLSGPDLDALHELQGYELAVSALLTSCEEEHIEPVQSTVENEIYGGSPT
jgi:hypothetical protein